MSVSLKKIYPELRRASGGVIPLLDLEPSLLLLRDARSSLEDVRMDRARELFRRQSHAGAWNDELGTAEKMDAGISHGGYRR